MKEKFRNFLDITEIVLQAVIVVLNTLVLINGIKARNNSKEND